MSNVAGKWVLVSTDKYEEYLKSIWGGTLDEKRMHMIQKYLKAGETGVTEELTCDGNFMQRKIFVDGHLEYNSAMIPIGEEVDLATPDHRTVKCMITLDGPNKYIRKETTPTCVCTIMSVITGNDRTMTMTCGSATCTRKYKRIM